LQQKVGKPRKFGRVATLLDSKRQSISQLEALRSLLKIIGPDLTPDTIDTSLRCEPRASQMDSSGGAITTHTGNTIVWKIDCVNTSAYGYNDPDVFNWPNETNPAVGLAFHVTGPVGIPAWQVNPTLNNDVVYSLLQLPGLKRVAMAVYGGSIPVQLEALPAVLDDIEIKHYCLQGTLPPSLLQSWRSITRLVISSDDEAITGSFEDPQGAVCGLTGSIPQAWFVVNNASRMTTLDLSGNR
jgi:hypothetical protein